MQPVAEAFLETTWDDAESARAARDNRAAQLQAAGYECSCANLWNVAGYRVYVVRAELARAVEREAPSSSKPRSKPFSKRPARRQIAEL